MEGNRSSVDLLAEAVETAGSLLTFGDPLSPFMITDRWADRRVEQFKGDALSHTRSGLGSSCAQQRETRVALSYMSVG